MIPELAIAQFADFFREVHGQKPFPWQQRLMLRVAENREGDTGGGNELWPSVLDLPTGFGKTAALDIAVFHLALEADRGMKRHAPMRIAFVVDRRLVVDDAFERANKLASSLNTATFGTVTSRVAARLQLLAGEGNPALVAARLRGGIPREDDWARTPCQPTIVCSTVDQIGSRLLFRGYGVSDSMKPVHAGLIGTDCLIILDEAHLSEPFRQTLQWVNGYKSQSWRETGYAAPWNAVLLTATPGAVPESCFRPAEEDYADSVLQLRWNAPKPASLIDPVKPRKQRGSEEDIAEKSAIEEQESSLAEERYRVDQLAEQALNALNDLANAASRPAIGVVVNRVARARAVFEELTARVSKCGGQGPVAEIVLLIGPARPVDRDAVAANKLAPIRTGVERNLEKPLVLVATQCIEAGVDIDLDGLVTEAAPLDSLRQRFGRLNRNGRAIIPFAAILGPPKAGRKKADPVYGQAITCAWDYLVQHTDEPATKKAESKVDFGLKAFAGKMKEISERSELLAPRLEAPVLLPAHLDLLSQTSPVPNADPEVALYLHGPNRTADAVTVVWREDVDSESLSDSQMRRLLLLVPLRTGEGIELPVWAVHQWLTRPKSVYSELTDVPGSPPDVHEAAQGQRRRIFHWVGDDERSRWIEPREIRAGCTIVVPAGYGGVDQYGWNPQADAPATDVADRAAEAFAGRRFAVRVSPHLFDDIGRGYLADALAESSTGRGQDLRDAVLDIVQAEAQRLRSTDEDGGIGVPRRADRLEAVAAALEKLTGAKKIRGKDKVQCDTEVYGQDDQGRRRGVVFIAPRGIRGGAEQAVFDAKNTTEDDFSGSLAGFAQPLEKHCAAVEQEAAQLACNAGLPEDRVSDIRVAAYLHDAGKVDARFQSWLSYGDPFGPDPEKPSEILAKSGRWLPPTARTQSALPEKWRHEAFSVRLAEHAARFREATDQDLVLWLIGTHHGHGRPLFPHADPADAEPRSDLPKVIGLPSTLPPGPGPQSLDWDRDGLDWAALYERLKVRYGVWELARMEAILRLADHRASEKAAREEASE
ncbi:MAG: type I-U CRISPR-associated helicase/endonuclease Cas3 [Acidobacteriota bacterium]